MLFTKPKIPIIELPQIPYVSENTAVKSFLKEHIHTAAKSICTSKLGRSEAVSVSPDFKKVAYASFNLNQITIFTIQPKKQKVIIEDCQTINGGFKFPHDLAWIDNSTIVVANREGPAVVFSLSENKVIQVIEDERAAKSNSVAIVKNKMIFCSAYGNYISYYNMKNGEIGIYDNKHPWVPDDVAASPSSKLIAVTNAMGDNISIYNLPQSKPTIVLEGIKRPHGVDFINEDLIVGTGANSPFVYFWKTNYPLPKAKLRVLSNEKFMLGRVSDKEGGVKGICVCTKLNLLFATCPNEPLVIFQTKKLGKVLASK